MGAVSPAPTFFTCKQACGMNSGKNWKRAAKPRHYSPRIGTGCCGDVCHGHTTQFSQHDCNAR
jgi:hypothetical protein